MMKFSIGYNKEVAEIGKGKANNTSLGRAERETLNAHNLLRLYLSELLFLLGFVFKINTIQRLRSHLPIW